MIKTTKFVHHLCATVCELFSLSVAIRSNKASRRATSCRVLSEVCAVLLGIHRVSHGIHGLLIVPESALSSAHVAIAMCFFFEAFNSKFPPFLSSLAWPEVCLLASLALLRPP